MDHRFRQLFRRSRRRPAAVARAASAVNHRRPLGRSLPGCARVGLVASVRAAGSSYPACPGPRSDLFRASHSAASQWDACLLLDG